MRKTLLAKTALTLIAALFSLTGARAAELSVYEGTTTNQYVPAYIYYFDQYAKSQFIIPATQLAAMNGCPITAVTFYSNRTYNSAYTTDVSADVYITEVNYTTINSFVNKSSATIVYQGTLTIAASTGELTIEFSSPFSYNGGNLLIGIENTAKGSYTNASFYGTTVSGASYAGYGNNQNNIRGSQRNFIPHTTFTYISSDAPTDLTVSHIGYDKATVNWLGNGASYNLKYRKEGTTHTTDFENSSFTNQNNESWTTINADGDRFDWVIYSSNTVYSSFQHGKGHGRDNSQDMIVSGSYCSNSMDQEGNHALTPDNFLISPKVALGGNITFWAKGVDPTSCEENFGVFVYVGDTAPTQATQFTQVGENKTATSEWTQYIFDLSAYEGSEGYVAIRHYDCTDQDLLCVDDIVIAEPGTTWTSVEEITGTSYNLTGLDELTGYQVILQAVNNGTGSAWAGTRFTTTDDNPIPVDVVVTTTGISADIDWWAISNSYRVEYRKAKADGEVHFFDDFESGLDAKGWTVYTEGQAGNNGGWYQYNPIGMNGYKSSAHSGDYAVVAWSWQNESNIFEADNWLITPKVTFTKKLKFWVRTNSGYPDSYEVLLSTNGNAISDFTVPLQAMAEAPRYDGWTRVEIDLGDYVDQEGYIAIHHVDYDKNYLLIDDFGFFEDDLPAGEWKTKTTEDLSVELMGLQALTEYEYKIIGIKNGRENAGTAIATFTTGFVREITLANNEDNSNLIMNLNGSSDIDVTLGNRTLYKDGYWNTLCLPFDLTIAGSILAGADVRQLNDATLSGSTLTLNFTGANSISQIKAGEPYIIKWANGSDIVNPVFEDVTIKTGKTDYRFNLSETENIAVIFQGTYSYKKFTTADNHILYMGEENTLYYPGSNAEIGAQRAFFQLVGIKAGPTNLSPIKQFVVTFDDDDATGIKNLDLDVNHNDAWYDLNGRKLADKPSQKGIYINNGKKTIIK